MINIFFEDKDSCIFDLFRELYKYNRSVTILCSGGSGNYTTEDMIKLYDGCGNILFYDVVPDNISTVRGYRTTCRKLRVYNNIVIIPIVSLEYYLLKAFRSDLVPDITALARIDYSHYHEDINSAEQYFKYVHDTVDCMSMHRFDKHSVVTSPVFYCTACRCNESFTNCIDFEMLNKSIAVWDTLPIHIKSEMLQGIDITIKDLVSSQIDRYNDFATKLLSLRGYTLEAIESCKINKSTILKYQFG